MTQLLITRDLMFSSRLASLAKASGIELMVVGGLDALQKIPGDVLIEALVLDLETTGVTAADVMEWIGTRSQPQPIAAIAYAPHGQVEKLRAARAAGFEQVLTRGQFHEQGETLINEAHAAFEVASQQQDDR